MNNTLYEKINEAKMAFGDKAAKIICEHYHAENFDEVNLKAKCPFHTEDTASFVWNPKEGYMKCFGCGKVVSIVDVYIETEGTFNTAVKRLFKETGIHYDLSRIESEKEDFYTGYKFPEEIECIDRSTVEEYWGKRGISVNTLDYMGIKEDEHGNSVFELRDMNNVLVAVKYRPSRAVKKGEAKMWWQKGADNCPMLFNFNKIDITKPILIVEGYGDCLSVYEAGFNNVVSIPGGAQDLNWIEFNYDILKNIDQFILWFDNDAAGEKGRAEVIQRLGEYRCKVVKPSKEDIEGVQEYYNQFNVKCSKCDANNVLLARGKERVLALINSAEEIPSKKLKFLMDCEIGTVKDLEKVTTSIQVLDDLLYGNLFGCFTIYSGKSSGGKSSVADIASIISPADHGYKTFVFSGELSDGQLADWIVSPLAGYNHIQRIHQAGVARPYYIVTDKARKAIQKYYHDKMIIYSDEEALETSGDSILTSMEEAYRRYGCRVFLIDNLMCISFENVNEDNKWETQKKFIIRLMNFTKKYNTCTNLILHPKKMSKADGGLSTESLHGASEVGNLCHRMLWIDRLDPEDEGYNTKITVVKDRPTQSSGKSCKLYYDEPTRRFYSTIEEQRMQFGWESSANIKYTEEEDKLLIKHDEIHSLPMDDIGESPPM